MNAFLLLVDAEDRALVENELRRVGCRDFAYSADEIGNGVFHYAIVQVFDETVEHTLYDMDPSDPRMQQLAAFIAAHPECYVIAITHEQCTNDGRLAHQIGADWWLMDTDLSLLGNALSHAKTSHHQLKGVPSWAREEVASANI